MTGEIQSISSMIPMTTANKINMCNSNGNTPAICTDICNVNEFNITLSLIS